MAKFTRPRLSLYTELHIHGDKSQTRFLHKLEVMYRMFQQISAIKDGLLR